MPDGTSSEQTKRLDELTKVAYWAACRYVQDADALDCAQVAMIAIQRRERERGSSWIYSEEARRLAHCAAKNAALDKSRKRKTEEKNAPFVDLRHQNLSLENLSKEQQLERHVRLNEAIDQLTESDRQLLRDYFWADPPVTWKELAQRYRVPAQTLHDQYKKILGHLLSLIEKSAEIGG